MFSQTLRQLRLDRGFTQIDLAKQVGITQQSIAGWEKGANYPNIDTLRRLANVLGVSVDYLIDNEPPPKRIFTAQQVKLINEFEELPPDGKDLILRTLQVLLRNARQEAAVG